MFAALHTAGRLLPGDDDRLRDALERNVRIIDSAAAEIPSMLANASAERGRDRIVLLGGLVDARLHVSSTGDEVWVAIATQSAEGGVVDERLRDVLFRSRLRCGWCRSVGAARGLALRAARLVRSRSSRLARAADLIRGHTANAGDVVLSNVERVGKRGGLTAEQCLLRALHPVSELFAVTLDLLVDGSARRAQLCWSPAISCGVPDYFSLVASCRL